MLRCLGGKTIWMVGFGGEKKTVLAEMSCAFAVGRHVFGSVGDLLGMLGFDVFHCFGGNRVSSKTNIVCLMEVILSLFGENIDRFINQKNS